MVRVPIATALAVVLVCPFPRLRASSCGHPPPGPTTRIRSRISQTTRRKPVVKFQDQPTGQITVATRGSWVVGRES